MKKIILAIVFASILLAGCTGGIEEKSTDEEATTSNTGVFENNGESATVSPDTGNEATEEPAEIDTASGETATVTDFSASSGATLTQSGN